MTTFDELDEECERLSDEVKQLKGDLGNVSASRNDWRQQAEAADAREAALRAITAELRAETSMRALDDRWLDACDEWDRLAGEIQ